MTEAHTLAEKLGLRLLASRERLSWLLDRKWRSWLLGRIWILWLLLDGEVGRREATLLSVERLMHVVTRRLRRWGRWHGVHLVRGMLLLKSEWLSWLSRLLERLLERLLLLLLPQLLLLPFTHCPKHRLVG